MALSSLTIDESSQRQNISGLLTGQQDSDFCKKLGSR